jgi:hypothetical protein
MNKSLTKNLFLGALLISIISLSGCTFSKEYGPYKGKVVDAATNTPLEGAVVFIRFYTDAFGSLGGPSPKFADSIQVVTDKRGRFKIPSYKVKAFRMLNLWDPLERVIIFKPGYGAFPKHPGCDRNHPEEKHLLPQNVYVKVKLPPLGTIEDRRRNLGYASYNMSSIPYEKQKTILKLINIERKKLGLQPEGVLNGEGEMKFN